MPSERFTKPTLDVTKIPIEKPVKIFNMMRIHNYPAVLEKFGFEVTESYVLPPTALKQRFVPDHQFVVVTVRNRHNG